MHAHTGVFGPAVRTNASRLGREVRNGGYPVWAICRLQAVLFYIFNRFDDIKLLVFVKKAEPIFLKWLREWGLIRVSATAF